MSKFSFLLVILIMTSHVFAQSTKVVGTVLGEEKEVIPGATIMLVGEQDSILKSYSITNKEGEFTLSGIKKGTYVLKASFFGFLPYELFCCIHYK